MVRLLQSLIAYGRIVQELVKIMPKNRRGWPPASLLYLTHAHQDTPAPQPCWALPGLLPADDIDDLSSEEQHAEEETDAIGSNWNGFLWGVPKKRVNVERRWRRRFEGKYMQKIKFTRNLIPCVDCGSWHQANTLCGTCYDKVRQETKAIQAQMGCDEWWNTDKKEALVMYQDDAPRNEREADFRQPVVSMPASHRIVQMPSNRPTWFAKVLLTKPRALLPQYFRSGGGDKSSSNNSSQA